MPDLPSAPQALEIRIGNVPLGKKLDAVSAAIVAIRDAHRDDMQVQCWSELNLALEHLGCAILSSGPKRRGLPPAPDSIPTLEG